ncbi:LuxE/PaaK family acyltransferase [Methanohalophilus profundi]|uniref:LuxE/PaaK family acyltransferase n=1 Tax=Methanohalophilus profundi TaxID=2138083 RepID=UPI001CDC3F00|nr:AMP-binding protein [Methanohalophilus profundi]
MNYVDFLFENSKDLDKVAIEYEDKCIDYSNLYSQVNSLASYLNDKYGAGNQIMLLSENNLFFIISYLSILKSGNVAVLAETRISDRDLETVLSSCSIKCIFAQSKYTPKFNNCDSIFTESVLEELPDILEDCPRLVNPNDLAVVVFTSGSTGTKKGVMLSHKNLIANTCSIVEYLGLDESDKVLVALPFFYCYGASLLHTHLRAGGSVVLSNSIFLGSVLKDIDKYRCTGFSGVPSTFQILINRTPFLEQEFPTLRYFTQAGGKLENKFITRIADAFPDKSFYVMYGATEATSRMSYLPPHLIKEKLGSIGKGIPGVKLEVLNSSGNPIKPGEIGEITAVGENIMQGYLNDTEGTKKKVKNGRLYTDDLATIDEDGFIYIVGRANNLIKSAGYRIAPNEIQDIINGIKGVNTSVVIGINDDIMGEAVTAVVKPSDSGSDELKEHIISLCSKNLPSYKVPKHIVFMDAFPLNSSNKIDRIKLKETVEENLLKSSNPKLDSVDEILKVDPYSLTDSEKEAILLPILKEQLQKAQNNPHIKNFFEKQNISVSDINSLEDIPPLPVQMFKYFDLEICPKDEVYKILQSSGTTSGKKSRVPLSKTTTINQTKALKSILSDYLGKKRRIFLVIDHEGMNNSVDTFSARTAGIRGLSIFSKKIFYLLKEENGKLVLNLPVIKEVIEKYTDYDVYVFGFTYIIWSTFYKQILDEDLNFSFNDIKIFHSGGWKKLKNEQVSKEVFSDSIANIFNTESKNVLDFYGMAEQTGIIFVDCEYGNKHVPAFSQVIVRDPQTLKTCDVNQIGMIEVMSVLADSYYGQAILTEDLGHLVGMDNCPCGRKGRYFKFKSRVEKAEVRGCGDTFKE